jgi:hypothetical protein
MIFYYVVIYAIDHFLESGEDMCVKTDGDVTKPTLRACCRKAHELRASPEKKVTETVLHLSP